MEDSFTLEPYHSTLNANETVHKKYIERMKRTYSILQSVDLQLANEVFKQQPPKHINLQVEAAIRIQKSYRGYKARKEFKLQHKLLKELNMLSYMDGNWLLKESFRKLEKIKLENLRVWL